MVPPPPSVNFRPSKCVNFWKALIIVTAVLTSLVGISIYFNDEFEPVVYRLPQPPALKGPLKPNNYLRNAQLLLKGKISGPESLVVEKDGKNTIIYTGTWDGKLLKIANGVVKKTLKIRPGKKSYACGGSYHTEPKCGRPLGIRRLNEKEFIVAEAYSGLYSVDFENGVVTQIFSTEILIENKKCNFANDLDILDILNGTSSFTVFLSHSSTRWDRRRFLHDFLEGKSTGRLLRIDFETIHKPQASVALEGLAFANGVQLHPDGETLLVSECSRARILRYHHSGPKKGQYSVFIKNLPGFPDNIRLSSSGQSFFVGMASVRHSEQFISFIDFLGRYPWIRWGIVQLVPQQYLASLLTLFSQKYGLVLELDLTGKIIRSYHDPTGTVVQGVSQASDDGNFLYLGSFHADFIAKVPMKGG
ncbi:Str_synth domain-containing protein [Meloidogyne graminicola]|uniref:Str_synth domain-containing protein n=1 Tax=Meloidogyne graminicola TaxID=189291 RepID=A0A8S9ZN06_9BILA|nr:Str_synth domain-containing protein [Meloidogyne graminicola]